jgi:hypothetical protein
MPVNTYAVVLAAPASNKPIAATASCGLEKTHAVPEDSTIVVLVHACVDKWYFVCKGLYAAHLHTEHVSHTAQHVCMGLYSLNWSAHGQTQHLCHTAQHNLCVH